jgi:hypothetical protein
MKKRQLLLRAAAIVEKADPARFCMVDLNCCALAHIGRREGFKRLKRAILSRGDDHFLDVAARYFGIRYSEAEHLFGGAEARTPAEEAELIRICALKPERKRRPKKLEGMKVIERAIKEATSVPARRTTRV